MKNIKLLAVLILTVGLIVYGNACTMRSYRVTPVVKIVRGYSPAVVNIRTERIIDLRDSPEWGLYGEKLDLFLKQYFGEAYSEGTVKHKSIGSGVILNNKGFIVTNAHVIQKASSIYVVLTDKTILEADILEVSESEDLAIIKTELPYPVKEIKFADSKELLIGETVIAIGNPLGLENSVTVGVLSGKDRSFSNPQCEYSCSGLLQTDASINPGNSGGPLLNLDGELVGINLAVIQNAQNIGFAVPAGKVAKIMEKYK